MNREARQSIIEDVHKNISDLIVRGQQTGEYPSEANGSHVRKMVLIETCQTVTDPTVATMALEMLIPAPGRMTNVEIDQFNRERHSFEFLVNEVVLHGATDDMEAIEELIENRCCAFLDRCHQEAGITPNSSPDETALTALTEARWNLLDSMGCQRAMELQLSQLPYAKRRAVAEKKVDMLVDYLEVDLKKHFPSRMNRRQQEIQEAVLNEQGSPSDRLRHTLRLAKEAGSGANRSALIEQAYRDADALQERGEASSESSGANEFDPKKVLELIRDAMHSLSRSRNTASRKVSFDSPEGLSLARSRLENSKSKVSDAQEGPGMPLG